MQNHESQSIDKKEIRGITGRLLLSAILGMLSIFSSVLWSYYSLRKDISKLGDGIDKIGIQREGDNKYNDLRIHTIEVNLSTLEYRINKLEENYKNKN